MSIQVTAVFPDTNLFLHCLSINEVDWCALIKSRPVDIKIAPVVMRELEQQRVVHQSRKIRDRAESAVKFLWRYLEQNQLRDGVTLEFLSNEPTPDYAAAQNLNLLLADDWLVGTYLLYREANPHVRCIVVTKDLPLTVKLKQRQIEFISLDESFLLPSPPDPLEKRNKELEAELLRYKSREPDLALEFADGQNFARFRLTALNTPDPEPEIRAKLAAAKEKCKPVELEPAQEKADPNNPFATLAEQVREVTGGLYAVRRQLYGNYNRRVEQYYLDYEKYLRDMANFKTIATRKVKLELIVHNSGNCPAEDIDVQLHFPDGFLLYNERKPPKQPEEPALPSIEPDLFPSATWVPDLSYIPRMPAPPDPTLPRIRKTKSYDVDFKIPKLKHGFIWTIEPFYVVFESLASAASFAIAYTIHAANMIDEQSGRVAVVIEKN